ncbi:hypothetical protein N836_35940 [Leptolyngbya sp. Heron Island J]|uniref:hypothetical protein n=1 Tax=Leptolyngbya sp. Heron Island J TaxID=1385935 RepID=UPI0003B94286|nr:hypothetical protein [Leptolyngbya sp. Heron Island J]ESA37562.1 hypothetical protein N836_35940 [Leptolyngbya sp. Heron Island J]
MVNSSGHIEQQLSKLQTQTADIATELEALVDKYLRVLSQAGKRQLVLAAYHVCTQVYPENFLALSLSQRDRLQQKLRELGNQIEAQLNDKWDTAKRLSLQPAEEDGLAVIRQLFLEAASARETPEVENASPEPERQPAAEDTSTDSSDDEQWATNTTSEQPTTTKNSQDKLLADIRSLIDSESLNAVKSSQTPIEPMQPAQLMRRQILIEKAIRDVLKVISEKANEILQKADVMPEIPQALLTATAESERFGHIPMKTPNLVRLSIKILHEPHKERFEKSDEPSELDSDVDEDDEAKSEEWSEAELSAAILTEDDTAEDEHDGADNRAEETISMPQFLQLESLPDFVMIHLRLSEIEFAETNVAVWRSRIRKKMAHLKQIGHAYKDSERQLAIAQAEDAWRASWTND